MAGLGTPSATAQQPATGVQQCQKGLLQTPPCNSGATVTPATGATGVQHLCNKAQQRRNSTKIAPRNSATSPFRGGETVAPSLNHPRSRFGAYACGFARLRSTLIAVARCRDLYPPTTKPAGLFKGRDGEGGIDLVTGDPSLRARNLRLSAGLQFKHRPGYRAHQLSTAEHSSSTPASVRS